MANVWQLPNFLCWQISIHIDFLEMKLDYEPPTISTVLEVTTYCIIDQLEAPVNKFALDSENCKSN